jgi:hypothetical protein
MNDRPKFRGRGAPWWGWLLALLLLPLAAPLTPAAAPAAPAPISPVLAGSPQTPRAPILFGSFRQILGDQTAMIQVAVVVGAISIFWLTRNIGKG